MPLHYPLSAVLGCDPASPDGLDDLGLALLLTALCPEVGGVLVRGQKGTAKSTAARALAAVLPAVDVVAGDRYSTDPHDPDATSPDGPFGADRAVETRPVRLVELPVGTTEDRLLGAIDLERALGHGQVAHEPGLLAHAHRGLLYVDEVNLLQDHLVDLLLDAAATGRVQVERDHVSLSHAARFVLIGTMNPEEGELRPQLLDRFGLSVEVAAPTDPAKRVEVVRRRLAFDADPAGFTATYAEREAALRTRVADVQRRLADVTISDAALLKVAEVCAAFEVDGLRADIVTTRAARAHAAWSGRTTVTLEDIRQAARLALPHRRRRTPFDAPGLDEDLLDEVLGDEEPTPDPPEPTDPSGPDEPDDGDGDDGADGDAHPEDSGESPSQDDGRHSDEGGTPDGTEDAPGESESDPTGEPEEPAAGPQPATAPPPGTVTSAETPYRARTLRVRGVGTGAVGRRSRARTPSGRRVGLGRGRTGSLDLPGTLRAAAPAQHARGRSGGPLLLRPADLRTGIHEGREANLVLLCVDASGSMAARRRMGQVKAAVLSLLDDAYRRRDKVGLVTFRGNGAEVVLPPTRSVDVAATRLDELPAGGRTPLAEGLLAAAEVLQRERLRDPRLRPLLVVVTDGRATHGPDPLARAAHAAAHVAALGVTTVVVDSESGPMRMGLAQRLAGHLGAEHLPVAEVSADALAGTVRERVA